VRKDLYLPESINLLNQSLMEIRLCLETCVIGKQEDNLKAWFQMNMSALFKDALTANRLMEKMCVLTADLI